MNKTFDRFAGMAFLATGAAFVIGSRNISQSAYGSSVGANIFPLGFGVILFLLSIRLLYESFRAGQVSKKSPSLDYKKFIIILLSALGYAFLLEVLGYVICTFLFLLIAIQTMERGKWLISVTISATFSFGIYYLYVKLMNGTLPGLPAWLGL